MSGAGKDDFKGYLPEYPFKFRRGSARRTDDTFWLSKSASFETILGLGDQREPLTKEEIQLLLNAFGTVDLHKIKLYLSSKYHEDLTKWCWVDLLHSARVMYKAAEGQCSGSEHNTTHTPVGDKELTILVEMAAVADKTLIQEEIAACTGIPRGTVKDVLAKLEKRGLVHRPLGERQGYLITDVGRKVAERNQ